MHQHSPRKFAGPVRGSPAWWRGLEPQLDPAAAVEEEKKPRKRSSAQGNEPQIRKDLVERVRKEIEAGTYDTQEKWEAALDSLLDHLAE